MDSRDKPEFEDKEIGDHAEQGQEETGPSPVEKTSGDISPPIVGAQRMAQAGFRDPDAEILIHRVIGGQQRCQQPG